MYGEGTLWVIAEVAIGFAGFTGVVAVFGKSHLTWASMDAYRFTTLWISSLSAMVLALVPFLFVYSGLSESEAWRYCSAGLAVYLAIVFLIDGSRTPGLFKAASNTDRVLGTLMAISGITILSLQIWNASRETATILPYLLALFHFILVSSIMFGRLLTSVVTDGSQDSDTT